MHPAVMRERHAHTGHLMDPRWSDSWESIRSCMHVWGGLAEEKDIGLVFDFCGADHV